MKRNKPLLLASLSVLGMLAAGNSAAAFDESQKKEIGELVREYLIEHPEVMLEVQQSYEKKQADARLAQAREGVAQNKELIFNAPGDIALGNPNGKITVVEFFDYNCGYCRQAIADMDKIIKSQPDVKFVLKELPILGRDSVSAHRIAGAFRQLAPEKYGEFHRALLGGSHADEARAIEVAKGLGVTESQIRDKLAAMGEDTKAEETYRLASNLGINATPTYVLGDEAIFGAAGAETLNEKINNLNQCGKTVC